jgi:hypothetical protein
MAEGDLRQTANPDALAAFIMAIAHGIAGQAKAGFNRDMLGPWRSKRLLPGLSG